MSLDSKVAIVTGQLTAASAAPSRSELARQGAAVTINYHHGTRTPRTRPRPRSRPPVAGAGDPGATCRASTDIQRLVDGTVAAFGRLDIMVNNAGMETRTSTLETTEHQFDLVIAVDLKSAFFGVQLAAKQMIAQGGGGRIINISSIHEDWPMPGNAPYCAAKGGVRMLTRTAGVELAPARHHGRRGRSWCRPHADRRGHPGRPGWPRRGSRARSRSAAWPSPRRSPRSWHSSRPMRPRTAPPPRTRSTAG